MGGVLSGGGRRAGCVSMCLDGASTHAHTTNTHPSRSSPTNAHTTKTYLLQLKLSPPADVGISVERRSDATSNGGGIHCGQAVGPTIAPKALRGDGCLEGRVVCGGCRGAQKKFGPKSGCNGKQVGKGPEWNGGAEFNVGSGSSFTVRCRRRCLSAQSAALYEQHSGLEGTSDATIARRVKVTGMSRAVIRSLDFLAPVIGFTVLRSLDSLDLRNGNAIGLCEVILGAANSPSTSMAPDCSPDT
jgi:hypothetical protein